MYGDDDGNTVIGRRLGDGICDRCFDHPRAELVQSKQLTEAECQQLKEKQAWAVVKEALKAIPDTDATTTPFFWDCECNENFIHAADVDQCSTCFTRIGELDSAPLDSHLREVLLMLIEEAGL